MDRAQQGRLSLSVGRQFSALHYNAIDSFQIQAIDPFRPWRGMAMLQRRSVAIGHCLNRAAECGHLATLADDHASKLRYLQLAEAWLKLATPIAPSLPRSWTRT